MISSMEPDPTSDEARQFLLRNFADVRDEPAQGDFYVFGLKTNSGQTRHLKVHRRLFVYSGVISEYLQKHDFVGQLEGGDVEIIEPLPL